MAIPVILLPPIPEKLPPRLETALKGMRHERRVRLLQGLYILSASGLSVMQELRAVMEMALGVAKDNGSVKRVFLKDLPEVGWAIKETPYFIRSSRLALLRLSDQGRKACWELGWPVIESEWERLIRSHEGLLYPRHTLGLLAFCWQARLRGWRVELLPQVSVSLEPDLLISKSEANFYTEFEIRAHEKLRKWKKIHQFQGFVALCSFLPETRAGLVTECKYNRIAGIATDLHILVRPSYIPSLIPLWSEKWGN